MGFFDKLKKSKGGYIFLSHSHDDILKVREIRNDLEKQGFEPLCFYLKCLEDEKEIADLIKREIDAREWFLFVNSENSRKSKWVTLEREYITKTDKKKIITVDLDDEAAVKETVNKIIHSLRVFVSYASADEKLARRIKNKLEEKDYLVFFAPDSVPEGMYFEEVVAKAIRLASAEGCVLALLTENSVKSRWVMREIENAIYQGGKIFPVILGDIKLSPALNFYLSNVSFYHLPQNPDEEDIDRLVDTLGNIILKQ